MATVAARVARTLLDGGVTHVFGVVGNGNFRIADALASGGARYVAARHEGGAVVMADAFHRVTGRVAVCTATYGPGFTNLATGLADAAKQAGGVLVVTGDAPTSGLRRIDVDQAALARTLGARVVRITEPSEAGPSTAAALRLARAAPCPVVLLVPSDLLDLDAPGDGAAPAPAVAAPRPDTAATAAPWPDTAATAAPWPDTAATAAPWPDTAATAAPAEVAAVMELLASARRPLLLAGLGAWRSGAGPLIARLADRTGALLATTVMAGGLFTGNPWSLGVCGGFAAPRAAELIGSADVVAAFGASLGHWTLHGGRMLAPGAVLVQVDTAGRATSGRVDLCVTGDAAAVAGRLLDAARARGLAPGPWRAEAAAALHDLGWHHVPYEDAGRDGRIDPRSLTRALAGLLPADRTLVTDGGHFIAWPAMYWPVADPSALVFTGAAFQSIGLGFAGAVGAAVARSDRMVVAALGDGGALMGLPELETLVRVAESALVVVYDDAAYGAEVHMYGRAGAESETAVFESTDFAGVARSLGASAVTVRDVGDLDAVRQWLARGARGVMLLDCKVVRDVVAVMLAGTVPADAPGRAASASS
ncbi:thiamine pyrophosphate-binding protein [Actinomadura nitritigenes]|uniref:thiamine pyrophosphate-binding protein n=1 Tax=Actinomadura nitritigenes TaxID=134602 RepID=UPI003D8C6706